MANDTRRAYDEMVTAAVSGSATMVFKYLSLVVAGALLFAAALGLSSTRVFSNAAPAHEPAGISATDSATTTMPGDAPPLGIQAAPDTHQPAPEAAREARVDAPIATTLEAASSGSVATTMAPSPTIETVTNGNATARTAAEVVAGGPDGLSVSYTRECTPGGSCASSTAVTATAGGEGVAYASSVATASIAGSAAAGSSATAGSAGCGPVAPALKTAFGPDGRRIVTYEYSTGAGCAKTETEPK